MKLIKELFAKGYLPYKPINPSKKNKNILTDASHEEFRQALLSEIALKCAENYHLLSKPVRSMEQKGEYNGVIRVYEDLINWFTSKTETRVEAYQDPKVIIEREERERGYKDPRFTMEKKDLPKD